MRGSRLKIRAPGRRPKIGMEDRLIAMIPVTMAIPTQTTEMTAPKHLRGMPIVRRRETAKSRRPARPLDHRLATLTAIYPVSKSAPALRTEAFRMQSASMTRVVRRSKLGAARSPIASVRNFLTGAWRPENTSIACLIAATVSSVLPVLSRCADLTAMVNGTVIAAIKSPFQTV
jgi:hypothetical protein